MTIGIQPCGPAGQIVAVMCAPRRSASSRLARHRSYIPHPAPIAPIGPVRPPTTAPMRCQGRSENQFEAAEMSDSIVLDTS